MKSKVIWLFAILLAAAVIALSQDASQPGQPGPQPTVPPPQAARPHQPGQPEQPPQPAQPPDPIAQILFPPELVMQHRQELGLTDEQRAAIKDEAIKASTRF